jgi:GPH family glycoside/pentoside/hexuronide:cation symporter
MGSIRFIFAIAAAMLLSSTTMALVGAFGAGQKGWSTVAVLYALIFVLFQMITVFGVREMRQGDTGGTENQAKKAAKEDAAPFGKSLLLLLKNKYFLIMLGIYLVNYISGGVSSSVGIYFTAYKLGNPALLGLLSMAGMVPMVVMLSIVPQISGRWGMQKTCLAGSLISVVGSLVVVFSNGFLPVFVAGTVIRSIGGAPLIGTMYALVAETAEYAFLKFKTRMDGIIYSCSSVGIKVGSGLGVAIAGWLLAAGRYDGLAEAQPQSAVAMINGMYVITPLIGSLALIALLALLNVEKTNKTLKSQEACHVED